MTTRKEILKKGKNMLESFLYFEKDFNIETIVRDIFVLDILNRMDGDCSQCDQIGPLLNRLGDIIYWYFLVILKNIPFN